MRQLVWGLAAMVTTGQEAAPLKSSGPWVARYEEKMCVLSRPYGAEPAKLQLALRPVPGDAMLEMVLILPNTAGAFGNIGKAKVELLPTGQSVTPYYRDYSFANGTKRMVRFFVTRDAVSDLTTAASLRIALDKETLHLTLSRTADALKAIGGCEDEMLRDWGIDPEAMRRIATPASPLTPEEGWIGSSDYPFQAITRNRAGAVRLRWTVDANGKVTDCGVIESSGHASLDALSCQLITERGRYRPAIDREGNPTTSFRTKTVQWALFSPTLNGLSGG